MSLITHFPIDLTGRSSTNLITAEEHLLLSHEGLSYRVFTLNNGGFYTQGLRLYNSQYNLLIPNVDYIATYVYADASQRVGLEICGALVILNAALTGSVFVTAQMVGGDYAFSLTAQQDTIDHLQSLGDQTPVWAGYVGVEPQWSDGQLARERWSRTGYERVSRELERIAQALVTGDPQAETTYRDHVRAKRTAFTAAVTALTNGISEHIANRENPHNDVKGYIGLWLVNNLPVATEKVSRAGISNEHYQTPQQVHLEIDELAMKPLDAHTTNYLNPHQVTAAKAGIYTKSEFDNLLAQTLEPGETITNARYIQSPEGRKSYPEVVSDGRANLPAENFTTGVFAPARLGQGTPGQDTVLRGDGSWTNFNALVKEYGATESTKLLYAGQLNSQNNALNHISVTYNSTTEYPVGTIVFYRTAENYEVGGGNGSAIFTIYPMRAAARTASGWINF